MLSSERPRGLFITGTDTGVGKTILSAALIAAMRAEGEPVRAHKPVVTGLGGPSEDWPHDHVLLGLAAGMDPDEVAPLRFEPPVSPHLAAEMAGEPINATDLLARARAAARGPSGDCTLIVEGVGGLLVPLTEKFSVCNFAAGLGMGVLIAARSGLGTINHTLLTLQAARAAGLEVRAVVLTPWPQQPSAMELSNRDTIAQLGEIEVAELPLVSAPTQDKVATTGKLAKAGAGLPWRRWLEPN